MKVKEESEKVGLKQIGRASCRERVEVEGDGDDRGCDGCMAYPTRGT